MQNIEAIDRYSDRKYKEWYEKYLEQFDYERSKVAAERLLKHTVKFSRLKWICVVIILLLASLIGSFIWQFKFCCEGAWWAGLVSALFQNASMGLFTGLILMMYTMRRDSALSYNNELQSLIKSRLQFYQLALAEIWIWPFKDMCERDCAERNLFLLRGLVSLSCHIAKFYSAICEASGSKKDADNGKYVKDKVFCLWNSQLSCSGDTYRKRFEEAYKLVEKLLYDLNVYAIELGAIVFEMQYGGKAVRVSNACRCARSRLQKKKRRNRK